MPAHVAWVILTSLLLDVGARFLDEESEKEFAIASFALEVQLNLSDDDLQQLAALEAGA